MVTIILAILIADAIVYVFGPDLIALIFLLLLLIAAAVFVIGGMYLIASSQSQLRW